MGSRPALGYPRFRGRVRPDGEEIVESRYFARDELDRVPVQPWVLDVLDDALSDRRRTRFDAPSWRPPASRS